MDKSKGTKIVSAHKKSDMILKDAHFLFIEKNYADLEKRKLIKNKYKRYIKICKSLENEYYNDGSLYTKLNSDANGIHKLQVGILLYGLIRQRLKNDWIKTRHFWIPKPDTFQGLFWEVWEKKLE